MANVNRLRLGSRVGEKTDSKSTGTVVDIINSQKVLVYWTAEKEYCYLQENHPSDLKLFRRVKRAKRKPLSNVLSDDTKCYGMITSSPTNLSKK